ncbi:MAG: hypothetical protein K8R77_05080 [Anaerolineaceae bacterium]|nr:hypothetical protein [Anaerolineaceae bacterium]
MPRKKRETTQSSGLWNILSVLALLCMVIAIAFVTLTYTNPYNQFNPFPPPTQPAAIVLPTEEQPPTDTPTPKPLPPTWTPTASITPLPSETPLPSATAALATPLDPDDEVLQTATPTPKVNSKYPFVLRTNPVGIDASLLYPSRGCRWSGVGGQVVDMQDSPYVGITVQLGGTLKGMYTNEYSLTGTATKYGEAGFEFALTDYPFDSKSELWVRLINQSNYPLSERVFFDTYADCGKNLIIINFEQVR